MEPGINERIIRKNGRKIKDEKRQNEKNEIKINGGRRK